jgi:hypothetical protein
VRYRLYGLSVQTDCALPGLIPHPSPAPPDVRVALGGASDAWFASAPEDPWYVSPRLNDADEPPLVVTRRAGGGWFRLRYADGIQFLVSENATRVAAEWPPRWSPADAVVYLTGAVCGLLLRLRGVPALHASAVAVDGAALAVCGPAGAGKSSTAAALAARGLPVLTDDVAPLVECGGTLHVQPSYPQLRLWPDVVPALLGDGASLPPLTPNWDKRFMDLSRGAAFQSEPLPLRAVYVLGAREAREMPVVHPMPPVEAVLTLAANAYLGWFPGEAAAARQFQVLSRLAASVPVLAVTPPADAGRLPALAAALEADFRTRTGKAADGQEL